MAVNLLDLSRFWSAATGNVGMADRPAGAPSSSPPAAPMSATPTPEQADPSGLLASQRHWGNLQDWDRQPYPETSVDQASRHWGNLEAPVVNPNIWTEGPRRTPSPGGEFDWRYEKENDFVRTLGQIYDMMRKPLPWVKDAAWTPDVNKAKASQFRDMLGRMFGVDLDFSGIGDSGRGQGNDGCASVGSLGADMGW